MVLQLPLEWLVLEEAGELRCLILSIVLDLESFRRRSHFLSLFASLCLSVYHLSIIYLSSLCHLSVFYSHSLCPPLLTPDNRCNNKSHFPSLPPWLPCSDELHSHTQTRSLPSLNCSCQMSTTAARKAAL